MYFRIDAESLAMFIAVREESDQPDIGGDPKLMIGCLKELEDPIARQASLFIVDFGNQRGAVISDESKKAAKPGRRPKPPLMILQQVMNDVVGQSVAFGVVVNMAIGPASKKSTSGGDPQRTIAVFQQVIYVDLA